MARVDMNKLRNNILMAGSMIDALLKKEDSLFGFRITSITCDTELCDDDLGDEDENMGILVGCRWTNEFTCKNGEICEESSDIDLTIAKTVSHEFLAGYIMATLEI